MAISVDNTYLTRYSTDASDISASELTSALQQVKTDEETLDACKQFEAYMLEQMFKNMEESTKLLTEDEEEDDGGSGAYVDMFSDTYYKSIAEQMVNANQGIGIAEKLYESIKAQQGGTIE